MADEGARTEKTDAEWRAGNQVAASETSTSSAVIAPMVAGSRGETPYLSLIHI